MTLGPSLGWPMNVPVLSDGVVTLRAYTPADIDALLEMAQDPEMVRWTAVPSPHTREMSEEFAFHLTPRGWNDGTARHWAIEHTGADGVARFAGNLEIRGKGKVTDIGYGLHPTARGQGVMVRAVRLAVDWAFTHDDVEVVHWASHVGNVASLRVAHACGFELTGTRPGGLHERGRVLDAWTAVLRFGDAPTPRTRWLEPPVLETERVRLRPFHDDDVERVAQACSDPESRHWLNGLPHPYTTVTARGYLDDTVWRAAAGLKLTWAVADPATDLLLGNLAVMDLAGLNPTTGEIGYWMHPQGRGRGLMQEAVRLAIPYAFSPDGLDLRRLSLLAAKGNAASNRIAEKVGFAQVGVERQAELLGDGSVDDLVCYDLLR